MKRKKKIFGYELIMDLYHCDVEVMKSKEKLTEYIVELCKLIDMKRYGEPTIEYFGTAKAETAGYSIVQLIETSSITGHFSDAWERIYLNIFTCKDFDHLAAVTFTKEFFKCGKSKYKLLVR